MKLDREVGQELVEQEGKQPDALDFQKVGPIVRAHSEVQETVPETPVLITFSHLEREVLRVTGLQFVYS